MLCYRSVHGDGGHKNAPIPFPRHDGEGNDMQLAVHATELGKMQLGGKTLTHTHTHTEREREKKNEADGDHHDRGLAQFLQQQQQSLSKRCHEKGNELKLCLE